MNIAYLYRLSIYTYIRDSMGNVLISLDEEHEKLLRKLSQSEHDGKKGSLSAVVGEALEKLFHAKLAEKNKENDFDLFIDNLKKGGLKTKYKMYSKRSEIYD